MSTYADHFIHPTLTSPSSPPTYFDPNNTLSLHLSHPMVLSLLKFVDAVETPVSSEETIQGSFVTVVNTLSDWPVKRTVSDVGKVIATGGGDFDSLKVGEGVEYQATRVHKIEREMHKSKRPIPFPSPSPSSLPSPPDGMPNKRRASRSVTAPPSSFNPPFVSYLPPPPPPPPPIPPHPVPPISTSPDPPSSSLPLPPPPPTTETPRTGVSRKSSGSSPLSQSSSTFSSRSSIGTRRPDFWILALATLLAHALATLLGEVKFHSVRPTLKAARVHKTREALGQICLYLAAANEVCGTWAGFGLVNTRFARVCVLEGWGKSAVGGEVGEGAGAVRREGGGGRGEGTVPEGTTSTSTSPTIPSSEDPQPLPGSYTTSSPHPPSEPKTKTDPSPKPNITLALEIHPSHLPSLRGKLLTLTQLLSYSPNTSVFSPPTPSTSTPPIPSPSPSSTHPTLHDLLPHDLISSYSPSGDGRASLDPQSETPALSPTAVQVLWDLIQLGLSQAASLPFPVGVRRGLGKLRPSGRVYREYVDRLRERSREWEWTDEEVKGVVGVKRGIEQKEKEGDKGGGDGKGGPGEGGERRNGEGEGRGTGEGGEGGEDGKGGGSAGGSAGGAGAGDTGGSAGGYGRDAGAGTGGGTSEPAHDPSTSTSSSPQHNQPSDHDHNHDPPHPDPYSDSNGNGDSSDHSSDSTFDSSDSDSSDLATTIPTDTGASPESLKRIAQWGREMELVLVGSEFEDTYTYTYPYPYEDLGSKKEVTGKGMGTEPGMVRVIEVLLVSTEEMDGLIRARMAG